MKKRRKQAEPEFEDEILIIGIDSEYVAGDKLGRQTNDIVSYQAHVISKQGSYDWFMLLKPGQRLTLAKLLVEILTEGRRRQILKSWPTSIDLVAHLSLAELTSLSDFGWLRSEFDSIGRSYVTIQKPHKIETYDNNRNKRVFKVRLFDTMLLAPKDKKKLADLGKVIGIEKKELPEGKIEDMRSYSLEDPESFREYGIQDARISAEWLKVATGVAHQLYGATRPPLTLGGMAARMVLENWKRVGIDSHKVLGLETYRRDGKEHVGQVWNRHVNEPLAIEAFHGGRNETFFFGATERDNWSDWDLGGAYVAALQLLGTPNWERIRKPRSIQDFVPDVYGAAKVRFSFPEETVLPCLPVRAEGSLVFPLQGESVATGFEIRLAVAMGAKVELQSADGYILPMLEERPFACVTNQIMGLRRELKKGSPLELMVKEIGNSIYGKAAQGLIKRLAFNSRTGGSSPMPASPITNPFIAAQVTGIIRALLAEIMSAIPASFTILSVTTDGFITNAPDELVLAACQGPLAKLFLNARRELGENTVLEKKHSARRLLAWRTRGQATVEAGEEPKGIVLAKAGLRIPPGSRAEQSQYIVKKFGSRAYDDPKDEHRQFFSSRELHQAAGAKGLTKKKVFITSLMDYDWKRLRSTGSTATGTREVGGFDHIWFSTRPLPSVSAFGFLRESWKSFSKGARSLLKTEADLAAFEASLAIVRNNKIRVRHGSNSGVALLVRMFVRAYFSGQCGLSGELQNAAVLRDLRELGFDVVDHDIENEKRNELVRGCLRPAPEILQAIQLLQTRFPSFDPRDLLVQEANPLDYDHEWHASLTAGRTPAVDE